ncbi:MAG: hypothetical protein ACRC4O_12020, partial [Giesbergeria sp.]
FESVAAFAAIHFDGNDLSIKLHSDDGTTDVAIVDSTVDAVDNTYFHFVIDARVKSSVKFYVNGVRLAAATTFVLTAYASTLSAFVHMEKTSNDTTAEIRVSSLRAWAAKQT